MIVSELTDISRGSERLCVDANWYSVCILACVCDFIYIVPLFLSVPVFLSTFIIQKSVFIFFFNYALHFGKKFYRSYCCTAENVYPILDFMLNCQIEMINLLTQKNLISVELDN